jgi:hypothetical protein
MTHPVRGTAQVVSCSANRGRGVYQNCHLQLVVSADGVPATAEGISLLERLAKLHASGVLSDEEFAEQQRKRARPLAQSWGRRADYRP